MYRLFNQRLYDIAVARACSSNLRANTEMPIRNRKQIEWGFSNYASMPIDATNHVLSSNDYKNWTLYESLMHNAHKNRAFPRYVSFDVPVNRQKPNVTEKIFDEENSHQSMVNPHKKVQTTRFAFNRNDFPQKSQMNGFVIDPVWYSRCLRKLIFFRNALSHRLHLCSSTWVCVLWWSCMVRLRLKLQMKNRKLFHHENLSLRFQNGCIDFIYPNPQTLHLYGRCSECTVICVNNPPRWWKLTPHNSQVNFRTAEIVESIEWIQTLGVPLTYVLLAAVAVSWFALALVHCDALLYDYLVGYCGGIVYRICHTLWLDNEYGFSYELLVISVVWIYAKVFKIFDFLRVTCIVL